MDHSDLGTPDRRWKNADDVLGNCSVLYSTLLFHPCLGKPFWSYVNSYSQYNHREKHQIFHETVGDTFNIYGQPSRKYWTESEAAKILSDWLRNLSSDISSKFLNQNGTSSTPNPPIGVYSPLIVDFKEQNLNEITSTLILSGTIFTFYSVACGLTYRCYINYIAIVAFFVISVAFCYSSFYVRFARTAQHMFLCPWNSD